MKTVAYKPEPLCHCTTGTVRTWNEQTGRLLRQVKRLGGPGIIKITGLKFPLDAYTLGKKHGFNLCYRNQGNTSYLIRLPDLCEEGDKL